MIECKHFRIDIPCEYCDIDKLKIENTRFRETLNVYANENNWNHDELYTYKYVFLPKEFDNVDGFELAQKALRSQSK